MKLQIKTFNISCKKQQHQPGSDTHSRIFSIIFTRSFKAWHKWRKKTSQRYTMIRILKS